MTEQMSSFKQRLRASSAKFMRSQSQRASECAGTQPKPPAKRVSWYFEGENKAKSVSWLVSDMIPRNCIGLIVGESRAGKTFLSLDLSVAVSEGREFFGRTVTKGSVLYVAAEGQMTIPSRLHAARRGSKPSGNIVAVMELRDERLTEAKALKDVIAEAQAINERLLERAADPISLVVIDTMISAFAISNWNDASEVSAVISTMRHIQHSLGATVIGVHHHGKDKGRGAAGSHFLMGGPDCVLEVYRDTRGTDTDRWFTLSKNRFGKEGAEFHFALTELQPDLCDASGTVSAYVEPCEAGVRKKKTGKKGEKRSAGEQCFERSFDAVKEESGEPLDHPEHGLTIRVPVSNVKAEFESRYPATGADPEEATRGAWRRLKYPKLGIIAEGEWLYRKLDSAQ